MNYGKSMWWLVWRGGHFIGEGIINPITRKIGDWWKELRRTLIAAESQPRR